MVFYAVAKGLTPGVFLNWNECKSSVNGFKNSLYKKFDTKEEAENFIISIQQNLTEIKSDIEPSISSNSNINKDIENNDFITDYYVYTDGACSNNGAINAVAGIGIFLE